MALPNGSQIFVKDAESGIVSARIVCGHFGGDSDRYIVITPDGGLSDEDLSRAEVEWVRVRPAGGGIPFGMGVGAVIQDMEAIPSDEELQALYVEAASDIRVILRRERGRGLVPGAVHREGARRDGFGVIDADLGGPEGDARAGFGVIDAGPRGREPTPLADRPDDGVAPAARPAGAGGQPVQAGPRVSGGLAALAKAIGGDAQPPVAATGAKGDGTSSDARVLTVTYDQTGDRFRSFRDAVTLADEVKWPDWPVPGKVLTVLWCLRFMLNRAGTPTLWHQTWLTLGKLNGNDHQVVFHDALCRILETAMCYDQLNGPALASMELVCRQIQCVEERYKDKFQGGDVAGTGSLEHHLMAGIQSRSQLCICPALNDWLAEEIRKQTAVDKERRKAREERTLARPSGGKDGKA